MYIPDKNVHDSFYSSQVEQLNIAQKKKDIVKYSLWGKCN